MMKFVAKSSEGSSEFALKTGVNLVGRDESCDIVINSTHVSRNHISCVVSRDRVVIQDLNSRNGTFVNGLRVKNSVEIKPGDVISLGKYTMVFADDGAEGEHVLPSMVVSGDDEDNETADETYRGETLPLKGDMARRHEGDENLPAKYNANRYAVTTRDNKIVLSNGLTGEALELYRGGPDAMTLDHLIAERRARQRRNMILAIGGGAVVLVLILALALMSGEKPNQRQTRTIDKEKYYLCLNDAVAFYTEGRKNDAATKLAEAKEVVGNSRTYNLHVQLGNLFDISDKLDDDWTDLDPAEANRIFNDVIDLDNLPDNFNILKLREWLTRKKAEIGDFATDRAGFKAGWDISQQIVSDQNVVRKEAIAALKDLRAVRANKAYADRKWKKYYSEEAWKSERTISWWLIKDALGEDPNDLESDIKDITVERANDMLGKVSAVLAKSDSIISDENTRNKLIAYRDNCFTVLEISREKQEAYNIALGLFENGEYLKAREAIKDFRDEDENEVIKDLIKNIDLALDVFDAYENAKKRYNAGDGEEALKILNAKIEDALEISVELHNKYDRLRRNVEMVHAKYLDALDAEKLSDVLKVEQLSNEIAQMVEKDGNESNWYCDWALGRIAAIAGDLADVTARQRIVDNYVAQAEKYFGEEDYPRAREFAQKANELDAAGKAGKNLFYSITRRGTKLLEEAVALRKSGKSKEALDIINRIIQEKIYNDGDGILDAARSYREQWRNN